MDGFRMYNIKQGHTISEDKMVMFFFIWLITYMCICTHANKCTCGHNISGKEKNKGQILGDEKGINADNGH